MPKKRTDPAAQRERRKENLPMETGRTYTRRDSLESFARYGKADSTSLVNLRKPVAEARTSWNPFKRIADALKRK